MEHGAWSMEHGAWVLKKVPGALTCPELGLQKSKQKSGL
jgi:hypothetical protein